MEQKESMIHLGSGLAGKIKLAIGPIGGHGDWGKGKGKSSFPHLNYEIDGITGHYFLGDKIQNKGIWELFKKELSEGL